MVKKILKTSVLMCVIFSLTACSIGVSGKNNQKEASGFKSDTSEITVYVPRGSHIDKKFIDDEKVAVNYLPDVSGDYSKETVDDIAGSINKKVKVLVINTDKKGLYPVFDKVKKNVPGVVTVACNIGELRDDTFNRVIKNPSLNVAFTLNRFENGQLTAKVAKQMNAKTFIYIYDKNDTSNPRINQDIYRTQLYSETLGLNFKAVEATPETVEESLEKAKYGDGTAIYSGQQKFAPFLLKSALKNGFILPAINSGNDGVLLAKELSLKEGIDRLDRKKFDNEVISALKSRNMEGKIAAISETESVVPAEIAISIAQYMYDKNFMIEECFQNTSLTDRGNRQLDMQIYPGILGVDTGYMRNLQLTPRILKGGSHEK